MKKTTTLKDLITQGLIVPPIEIQADLGTKTVEATINEQGRILIAGQQYDGLTQAMKIAGHHPESTSSAWQFWSCYNNDRQAWAPLEHLRAEYSSSGSEQKIRTSTSHPLRIDDVIYPASSGRIGMTFCPGKKSKGLYGGTWARDLSEDIEVIQNWGASTLISLMESHEFQQLGIPEFEATLSGTDLRWLHLPIKDMHTPIYEFEAKWRACRDDIHQRLKSGESIVIHCRGGLGRTGLLAARILVEAGVVPASAIAEVRSAREHAIETYAQEYYILSQSWLNLNRSS